MLIRLVNTGQRTQDSNTTSTDVLESPSMATNRFGLRPSPQIDNDSSSDDDLIPTQDLQSPSRAANLFTIKPSKSQATVVNPRRREGLPPPPVPSAIPLSAQPLHLGDAPPIGDNQNAHQPSSDHSPSFRLPMEVMPPPEHGIRRQRNPSRRVHSRKPPIKVPTSLMPSSFVSGGWEGTIDLLDALQKHEDTLRRLYANEQSTLKDLYACRLKLASHIHQLQTAIWARSTAEQTRVSSSV
ncbi:hypothetical protein BKA70DRAFT_1443188 [Coprinopsis sp. MPI-PUGE-AT-0042]|nr:hypothetical protein BKA70DRAFT_1443188 [Coprinopsis sp. MPI-PUGE-AT-0042]